MKRIPLLTKVGALAAVAASLLLTGSASATISFVDIHGVVTVNGVPTADVHVSALCCDTCQILNCTNADPATASDGSYLLSFNNDPAGSGGNCFAGCSDFPGQQYGDYSPWSVFLKFEYLGCTQYVSCEAVAAAYVAGSGHAVINVNLPYPNCNNTPPGNCATNPPPPPPCTNCVDSALGLGAAAGSSVLELGKGQVSITGPAGGILGDISIAPGGKLQMSGSEYITGTVRLGAGATFQNSSSGTVGGVQLNADLSAQIAAAYAAAANDAALPCNQTFTTLDGKTVTTITGGHGVNVICVKDISLSGKQILLTGFADTKFIFNITGKFVLTGGGLGPQIRVNAAAGLSSSSVLYNVIGTGQDVAFSGGGGGVSCCAAIVDGTILAPYRKIALAPGLVNGEIISGLDISIVSGSSVRCPPCPPPN